MSLVVIRPCCAAAQQIACSIVFFPSNRRKQGKQSIHENRNRKTRGELIVRLGRGRQIYSRLEQGAG